MQLPSDVFYAVIRINQNAEVNWISSYNIDNSQSKSAKIMADGQDVFISSINNDIFGCIININFSNGSFKRNKCFQYIFTPVNSTAIYPSIMIMFQVNSEYIIVSHHIPVFNDYNLIFSMYNSLIFIQNILYSF